MKAAGDESRPACLVARTDACPIVTVEVFVEENVIPPIRILLEDLRSPIDWPSSILTS
jgi:hypothetical protein